MDYNFLTKSASGYSDSDVANSMVRNLLSLLSQKIGAITEDEIRYTIEFFNFKCPYTGISFPFKSFDKITDANFKKFKANFVLDHIIPQNKDSCGLNLKGNLVYVTKEANDKKLSKSFDDFIMNRTDVRGLDNATQRTKKIRINKIKKFQKETEYDQFINKTEKLSRYLNEQYKNVKEQQETRIREIIEKFDFPTKPTK